MRNKSIQNTNIQTDTKVQRKDDRQTDMLRKFYSNLLGKENSTIFIIHHALLVYSQLRNPLSIRNRKCFIDYD